jgi:hypothetical protein
MNGFGKPIYVNTGFLVQASCSNPCHWIQLSRSSKDVHLRFLPN